MVVPNWTMGGKNIYDHEDFTTDVIGFVYCITYSNNQKYIGSKVIRSLVRVKPTKKQLAVRKNFVRKEWKNKPFVNYVGSHKETEGLIISKREILEVCSDKINLTYSELKHMVMNNVLTDDNYLNANCLGKFYKGKITSEVIYK